MSKLESQVFITNLAKYNNGELVGEWFTLSDGQEKLSEVLKRVLGNDEEYFITDFEADFQINEYDNLTELVEFATLFDNLDEMERTVATYYLNDYGLSRSEVLEKMQNDSLMDDCIVYEAENETDLGYAIAECMDIPKHLEMWIDYEAIGRSEVHNGATQVGDYFIIAN